MGCATLLLLAALAAAGGGAQAQLDFTYPTILRRLSDRIHQPLFLEYDNISFNMPESFLPNEYKNLTLANRSAFDEATVVIREDTQVPDLSFVKLRRDDPFSLFVPLHRHMAAQLVNLLISQNTYKDFVTTAIYTRSLLNPLLVSYALSVAILHRNDTQNQSLPNFACVFPGRFILGPGTGARVREAVAVLDPTQRARRPIEIPLDFTGTDLDMEHRVAYFREDIGINLHHWQWHLVYPYDGPRSIVNKDRRGELFYYLHEQINARYNFERFSNKLQQVRRLLNWAEPIPEGYFPKLDTMLANRVWPSRQANTLLSDIARPAEQLYVDLQDMERWRERLFQAIHDGRVQNENGSFVPLTEQNGIDILGNIIEASALSINPNLYGNIHNMGHVLIAYIHDPDHRNLEDFGVMGDAATAMRDPVFYSWHRFIDDIFQEYKSTLPRYTRQNLGFPNIAIISAEIRTSEETKPNVFTTFWQQSDLDLSRGLDFMPQGPILVRVTHLQHNPFSYTFIIQNTGRERRGTVRVFMAPKLDERGLHIRLAQQRTLYIELDKFVVTLASGNNTIQRNSTESSVTIPFERTFRNLDEDRPPANTPAEEQFHYCGCGWPQHMLIPKGTPEGLVSDLFVMVSDYTDDQVNQRSTNMCRDGWSYCGIRGERYPDRRAMGFPFDRPPPDGVQTVDNLVSLGNGNMFSMGVTIKHINEIL